MGLTRPLRIYLGIKVSAETLTRRKIRKKWENHFKNLLNDDPATQTDGDPIVKIFDLFIAIKQCELTHAEVGLAIHSTVKKWKGIWSTTWILETEEGTEEPAKVL